MIPCLLPCEVSPEKLQVPLPHESGFNASDNPYISSEFFKIYEDYGVPNDPMKYKDETFYWTYQHGIGWPNDYIGPDSMTQWIIEKSEGFTDVGLYRISESIRAYAYLILSLQASVRFGIVANTVSALTAQSAFLNKFEDIINRRVNIQEDIKHYRDTLSYASSKVDCSVGENIYMLPSDMNLKIKTGTVRYNNKILVSDEKFSLGKNDKVNALEPTKSKISHKVIQPTITHKNQEPLTITHNEEKIALIIFLANGFAIWNMFP